MIKAIKIAFMLLLLSGAALAQTAGLMPNAVQQFFDNNGNPLSSGTVTTYIPNTTTLKTTWQDAAETIPNTNPIILNAAGRAIIYGDGNYRQVVRDRNGNLIWDAVTSAFGTGGASQVGDGTAVGTVLPWAGITAPVRYVFAYGQELSRVTYSQLYAAITINASVACTIGSPILSGISDTSQISPGPSGTGGDSVEASCLPSGTKIISKTASTVTVNTSATVTVNTTARFFPWGNGNGTNTFNVPDYRGEVLVGRNNMGGTASPRLSVFTRGNGWNGLGINGGAESDTLLTSNLPAYTPSGTIVSTQGSHTHFLAASEDINTGAPSNSTNSSQIAARNTVAANVGFNLSTTGTAATVGLSSSASAGAITSTLTGAAQGGTSTPFSVMQPSISTNYIIKVLPDVNISTLNVVTSIQGMTGDITCAGVISCTGQVISASGMGTGDVQQNGTVAARDLVTWDGAGLIGSNPIASKVYIKDGHPWVDVRAWGAIGNGIADDTTAIQNAINAAQALGLPGGAGGATVFFPPGPAYCTFTGVTIAAGVAAVNLVGAGGNSSVLSACGHDITVVTMSASISQMNNMTIFGKGLNNPAETFGATQDAVVLTVGCVACKIENNYIVGGRHALNSSAPDVVYKGNYISFGYGSNMYMSGNVGGARILSGSVDQNWPFGVPSVGYAINNWAATTAYVAGDVVLHPGGYYIQAMTAGTSGGVAPTLRNYFLTISDGAGALTWQLASRNNSAGLQIDSNAAEVAISKFDVTGAYKYGIWMSNLLSGSDPSFVSMTDSTVSTTISHLFYGQVGSLVSINTSHLRGCVITGCSAIFLDTTWSGGMLAQGNFFQFASSGVTINGGTGNVFIGNSADHNVIDYYIPPNVSNWTLASNVSRGASANGLIIDAGTSNVYSLIGNDFSAATTPYSNSGSGTNINIVGNIGIANYVGSSFTASTFIASGSYVSVGTKIRAGGSAPALTSCGTSPAITGSDLAGEVTMGTGAPTGCVITFNAAYSSAPYCTVTWQATPLASQSYVVSTTAITLTQTGTSSNKVNYTCIARSAG